MLVQLQVWARRGWKLLATLVALFMALAFCGTGLRRNLKPAGEAVVDPRLIAQYERLREPVIDLAHGPEFWKDVDYS